MRGHIAEADDFAADVAFCSAAAIDQFVGRETREHDLWVGDVWVGLALLRDDEMAELAEDEFARAEGCAVVCETGETFG